MTDPLTGLLSREELLVALTRAVRSGRRGALVAYVDLDGLKRVNDGVGHHAGDQVLVAAAERLRARLGPSPIARLGGDEFVALVLTGDDQAPEDDQAPGAAGTGDRWATVQDLVADLSLPYDVGGLDIACAASVGVARAPVGGDPLRALHEADLAMYEAKSRGGGQACAFVEPLRIRAERRAELVRRVMDAVDDRRLQLLYQPVMGMVGGEVAGAEGLVRFEDGWAASHDPADLLGLARACGRDLVVTEWVLRRAIADAPALAGHGVRVAVNVPCAHLGEARLAPLLATAGPAGVDMEITDGEETMDVAGLRAALEPARAGGCRVYLDQIGSRRAPLELWRDLELDGMKLGRDLVGEVGTVRGDALIAGMVTMAAAAGQDLVAVGVETSEQSVALQRLGVRRMQGHLFGPPVTPAELVARIGGST